jgi:hypothetical protein
MMSREDLKKIAEFVKGYLYETAKTGDQDRVKEFPHTADHRWQQG